MGDDNTSATVHPSRDNQTDAEIHRKRSEPSFRNLPRQRRRLIEQGYFGVLDRRNVRFDVPTQRYELKYYEGETLSDLTWVPLADIGTERALTDWLQKSLLVVFTFFLLGAAILAPHANEIAAWVGYSPSGSSIGGTIMAAILLTGFALLTRWIDNYLVRVDADWSLSIADFLTYGEVKKQMAGIRTLMLTVRQFIKWRRFVNFFLYPFIPLATILITNSFFAAASGASLFGLALSLDENELAAVVVYSLGLWGCCEWLWLVRSTHTQWRDPTIQLCVLVAGMHQKSVEGRINQASSSSKTNVASSPFGADEQGAQHATSEQVPRRFPWRDTTRAS